MGGPLILLYSRNAGNDLWHLSDIKSELTGIKEGISWRKWMFCGHST